MPAIYLLLKITRNDYLKHCAFKSKHWLYVCFSKSTRVTVLSLPTSVKYLFYKLLKKILHARSICTVIIVQIATKQDEQDRLRRQDSNYEMLENNATTTCRAYLFDLKGEDPGLKALKGQVCPYSLLRP